MWHGWASQTLPFTADRTNAAEFDTTFPVVEKYSSIPKLSVQLLRCLAASRLFFPLMSSKTPVKSIESQGVLKNKALPELKMKLPIEPFKEESTDSSSDSDETSETENDEFTSDGPQKQGPKLECQIREYEEKYNFKGEAVLKLVEEKVAVDAKEEGKEYAMTSYKHYDRDGSLARERSSATCDQRIPRCQLQWTINHSPREASVHLPLQRRA
jgi:hypothetical protein